MKKHKQNRNLQTFSIASIGLFSVFSFCQIPVHAVWFVQKISAQVPKIHLNQIQALQMWQWQPLIEKVFVAAVLIINFYWPCTILNYFFTSQKLAVMYSDKYKRSLRCTPINTKQFTKITVLHILTYKWHAGKLRSSGENRLKATFV